MPNRSDTHVDQVLTNISVEFMQPDSAFITDQIFPQVPVQQQSGKYFVYEKEDFFRDDAQKRAPGTESAGGDYDVTQDNYFVEKYAFHKDVVEEDRINSDSPLDADRDATSFVVNKLRLNRENNWANTFFKKGVWATDVEGASAAAAGKTIYWDDYANGDPVWDIKKAATAMSQVTGQRPNTLVLGRDVYDALTEHPDFIDRIKFTQTGIVQQSLIASLFDVQRILVADAIQNIAPKGQEADMQFIMSKSALLMYVAPSASLRTASAGYTFTWAGMFGANAYGGRINRFTMPQLGLGTERIECELGYEMKVVAPDMGYFFSNIIEG